MNDWPARNTGLFDKAIASLKTKESRLTSNTGARRATVNGAQLKQGPREQRGAVPGFLDLRSALDFASTEADLNVACAHVQASLGLQGDGLSQFHFGYLLDDASDMAWSDMSEAERHKLLACYAVSEIMTFGIGPSMPSGSDDEPADALSDKLNGASATLEELFGPPEPSGSAFEAFQKSVETMTLRDHVARTRQTGVIGAPDTLLRVYAGQWYLSSTVDGAWRLHLGEDKWTTGPDLTLEQLEEMLFDHAVNGKSPKSEA